MAVSKLEQNYQNSIKASTQANPLTSNIKSALNTAPISVPKQNEQPAAQPNNAPALTKAQEMAAGAYLRAGMRKEAEAAQQAYNQQKAAEVAQKTAQKQAAAQQAVAGYDPSTVGYGRKAGESLLAGAAGAVQGIGQTAMPSTPALSRNNRELAAEAAKKMQAGETIPQDYYTPKREALVTDYDTALELRAAANRESVDGLARVGLDVAGAVGGMVPSLAANAVVPGAGSFVMGAQVFGNEFANAINNGADLESAQNTALLKGVTAAGVESLGGMFGSTKIASKVDDIISKAPWVKKMLSSTGGKWFADALSEGIEEGVEDVANYAIDKVMTEDDTPLEAKAVLYDMLLGALAGGVMSGGAGAINAGVNYSANKQLGKTLSASQSAVNDVVAEAMENPTPEKALLVEKIQSGKAKDTDIGKLYALNENIQRETAANAISNGTVTYKQIRAILNSGEEAKAIAQQLGINPETATQADLVNAIVDASAQAAAEPQNRAVEDSSVVMVSNPTNAAEIGYNNAISGKPLSEKEARVIAEIPSLRMAWTALTGQQLTGNHATDMAALKVSSRNLAQSGKAAVTEEQLAAQQAENVAAAKAEQTARIQQEAAVHQQKAIQHAVEMQQNTIIDVDGKRRVSVITDTDNRGEATIRYKKAEMTKEVKEKAKSAMAVAKALGKNIILYEGAVEVNGEYRLANGYRAPDGTIYLNVNSPKPMIVTLGHEMFHDLMRDSQFAKVQETLLSSEEYADSVEEIRQQKIELYARNGINLTAEKANEEVGADIAGIILDNENMLRYIAGADAESGNILLNWVKGFSKKMQGKAEDAYSLLSEDQRILADALKQRSEANVPDNNVGDFSLTDDEDIVKIRREDPERRRALRPGEMVNEFRNEINWREYYQLILDPEYNPDYYDAGDITTLPMSNGLVTIVMRKNGEFQVIAFERYENYENDRVGNGSEAGILETDIGGHSSDFNKISDGRNGAGYSGDSARSKQRKGNNKGATADLQKAVPVEETDANSVGFSNESVDGIATFDPESKTAAPGDYSLLSWNESEYVLRRDKAAKELAKKCNVDIEKARLWLDDINSVAAIIAADRALYDYEGNRDHTSLKPNSEYDYSLDFSTLCAKRLLFTGTWDEIVKRLPNTPLDSDDFVRLRQIMLENGDEVACGICYVESTRREFSTISQGFIDIYRKAIEGDGVIRKVNSKGEEKALTKNGAELTVTDSYVPSLYDLTTSAGIDALAKEHPAVHEAFISYMNARGQQKPKLVETRTDYRGEIARLSAKTVARRNRRGGLRVQSFSDFEVPHLIDMMQAILDMSAVGLKAQAYTKVPAFAEVVGLTGMKVNLSLIAEGDGVDADGNLIFSDTEGMPAETAFALREKFSENVGTILVGKNDAHIRAAMADPRIDFIIPFHKSSWAQNQLPALGLEGYDDYTDFQNEKSLVGEKIKNYDPTDDYWDFSKSGDENAEIYLAKCKAEGRRPKFEQFAGEPGYWKMLIDFKMYDNAGKGAPQQIVRPEFDMDAISRIFAEYEGGHQTLPVDMDAVDKFIDEKVSGAVADNLDSFVHTPRKAKVKDKYDLDFSLMEDEQYNEEVRAALEEIDRKRMVEARNRKLEEMRETAADKSSTGMGTAKVLTKVPKKAEASFKEKLKAGYEASKTAFINSMNEVERFGKVVGDDTLKYMANNMKQASAAAQTAIGDAQYDLYGKKLGKSLVEVFAPAKEANLEEEFYTYLLHVHNIDRMSLRSRAQTSLANERERLNEEYKGFADMSDEDIILAAGGAKGFSADMRKAAKEFTAIQNTVEKQYDKPVFGEDVTAEDSSETAAELLKEHPEFEGWAKDVYTYNDNLMKIRLQAGLVNQQQVDLMNDLYPHYVPTFRDLASITGSYSSGDTVTVKSTIKTAKGGNQDIMPIADSMARQTLQVYSAAKKNLLGQRMYKDAMQSKALVSEFIRSVEDVNEPLQIAEDMTDGVKDPLEGTFKIFVNGKPIMMQINEQLAKGLNTPPIEENPLRAVVGKANQTFKNLVTQWNPAFILRNATKDLGSALAYTKQLPGTYINNYARAYKEIAQNGELWQLYKAMGGVGSSFYDRENGLKESPTNPILKNGEKIFKVLGDLNTMVEQSNRMAEFIYQIEKGGRSADNVQRALYNAADITVNFGRIGTATRVLNRYYVPFFNAGIQGTDKLIRNFAEVQNAKEFVGRLVRFMSVGLAPAALTGMLLAALGDDEDKKAYKELSDYVRDSSLLIPVGDGRFFRVYAGREPSVATALFNRTLRFLQGNKNAYSGFFSFVGEQIAPANPLTDNLFSALVAMSTNTNWYGGDIVSQSQQNLPAWEQYDETTDAFSIWLGKISHNITGKEGLSPKKVNYLIDQYSGFVGDFVLPMMTKKAEVNMFAKAFVTDAVVSNRLSSDFYELKEQVTKAHNSSEGQPSADLVYSYLNKQAEKASDITKQIKDIYNEDGLTDSEKKEMARDLLQLRNEIYRNALASAEEYEKTAKENLLTSADEKIAKRETNREMFGAKYALEAYNKDVYEKAQELYAEGISYEIFYDAYFAQLGIKGDKDSNGKTITNSASKKKKAAIDKAVKASPSQKKILYKAFDISEKVW